MEPLTAIVLILLGIIAGIFLNKFLLNRKKSNPDDSTIPISTNNENGLVTSDNRELFIGNAENPDIVIKSFDKSQIIKTEVLPFTSEAKLGLEAMLQQAPNLISNSSNLVTRSIQLVFKPEVMQGLQNGTYIQPRALEGGYRTFAINVKTGKFVGHSSIIETANINPATTALIVWQVMAVVTAQKFLADINKKLANIEGVIESLKSMFENERYGALLASFNYLKHLSGVIKNQTLKDSEVNVYSLKLEDIELDCAKIMESLKLDYRDNVLKEFNSLELNKKLKDNVLEAKKIILKHETNIKTYYLALYVRLAAAQLRCSLPLEKTSVNNRITELENSIEDILTLNDKFNTDFNNKVFYLGSFWSAPQTNELFKNELKESLNSTSNVIKKMSREMKNTAKDTKKKLNDFNSENTKPISLVVDLDKKGNIEQVKKIIE